MTSEEIRQDVYSIKVITGGHGLQIVSQKNGLNQSFHIKLPDETSLFFKEPYIDYRTGRLALSVDREGWFYEQVWGSDLGRHLQRFVPEIIDYDALHHRLFLRYLEGWETLYSYHQRIKRYPISIARQVAELLSSIHLNSYIDSEKYEEFRTKNNGHPISFDLLGTRVTPETIAEYPKDGAKLVELIQRDPEMVASLDELKRSWQPICLIHKDIKLDNFMKPIEPVKAEDQFLVLLDWEFWDWGDPAWDIGAALGSYLMPWLLSLDISQEHSPEEWFTRAEVPFVHIKQAMNALWARYIELCHPIPHQRRGFSRLVIQYVALFLLGRILVTLKAQGYLSARSLSMLQIAKNLLIQPQKHISLILGAKLAPILPLSEPQP